MNFVKSHQEFHSTDVSHVQDYRGRQGFGGGGGGFSYSPGQGICSPMNPIGGPRGGGFGRSPGRFNGPGSFDQFGGLRGGLGYQSQQGFGPPRQKFGGGGGQRVSASRYSGFVKPEKMENHFEGGDGSSVPPPPASRPFSAPSMRHPYSGPRFPGNSGRSSGSNGEGGGPIRAGIRGLGRGPRFGGAAGRGGKMTSTTIDNFSGIEAANAAAARATREASNPNAKCIVLATGNTYLSKFKRLAEEIKKLKTKRPNAIDTIHSAANIAHVNVQSEIESGPIVRGTGTFFTLVQFDGVNVSVATGLNKRASKVEAFEIALQKLMKPYQRIVEIDDSIREFQAADYDFAAEVPKQTVIKPMSTVVANISGEGDGCINSFQKESNVEAIVDIKKKNYVAKELSDFVLVEPEEHNSSVNGSSMLRRSADFSKMLLEYDFAAAGAGGAIRCVLKVEGQVLADVVSNCKVNSKIEASQKAVDTLRQQCWTILTKQVHDSNAPEITKDEIFDDLATCFSSSSVSSMSTPIADSNKGKKLLEKMGWTGGGIGKDGAGIEEPVTMKQVINREGLGLDAKRGISNDFRARITELLENYAASERQDDLVFSPHFRKDERVIIHNECRRLNLKSKSNGSGNARFLIIRRKRSAFQLLEHVMRCGGETARYKVVPPGERKYPWRNSHLAAEGVPGNAGSATKTGVKNKLTQPSSSSSTAAQNKPGLLGNPGTTPEMVVQNLAAGMLANMASGMMGPNSAGMRGQNYGGGGMMGSGGGGGGMVRTNSGGIGMMMGHQGGMLGPRPGSFQGRNFPGSRGMRGGPYHRRNFVRN